MNKPRRKVLTNLTYEEIQSTIGQKVKYKGVSKTIGAVYIYLNEYGIVSIRVRLMGNRPFINVEKVYKKDNEIIYELKEKQNER